MAGGAADSAADALPPTMLGSANAPPTIRPGNFRIALTFIVDNSGEINWVRCYSVKKRRTWPHGAPHSTENLSRGLAARHPAGRRGSEQMVTQLWIPCRR